MYEAVILAAGCGSRMGGSVPKALLAPGGRTLLERHLEILADASCVKVVCGFEAALVASALPPWPIAIENPEWRLTGTLASLLRAAPFAGGTLLVVHGDLLWTRRMLVAALSAPGEIVVPVDPSSGGPEAMKAVVVQGRIARLSKEAAPEESSGESMGVFILRGRALDGLLPVALSLLREDPRASVDDLVVGLASRGVAEAQPLFIEGEAWEEIDTPDDLARAERLVSGPA